MYPTNQTTELGASTRRPLGDAANFATKHTVSFHDGFVTR